MTSLEYRTWDTSSPEWWCESARPTFKDAEHEAEHEIGLQDLLHGADRGLPAPHAIWDKA